MKVTRAQVVKALSEEPLWGGHWITPSGSTVRAEIIAWVEEHFPDEAEL